MCRVIQSFIPMSVLQLTLKPHCSQPGQEPNTNPSCWISDSIVASDRCLGDALSLGKAVIEAGSVHRRWLHRHPADGLSIHLSCSVWFYTPVAPGNFTEAQTVSVGLRPASITHDSVHHREEEGGRIHHVIISDGGRTV